MLKKAQKKNCFNALKTNEKPPKRIYKRGKVRYKRKKSVKIQQKKKNTKDKFATKEKTKINK